MARYVMLLLVVGMPSLLYLELFQPKPLPAAANREQIQATAPVTESHSLSKIRLPLATHALLVSAAERLRTLSCRYAVVTA
jgi:hypothetical protein